jgi:hypothetical protein
MDAALGWLGRHGWMVALCAGIAWIVNDLAMRASPDSDDWDCNSGWDYATNALDPPAFFLTAGAIWAVYLAQRGRSGRVGKIAALAAGAGAIAAGINNPIEHCGDVEILGAILWAPAATLLLFGTLVFALATVRARAMPIWVSAAMAAGVVAAMAAADSGGMIILGLTWIAVSYGLWKRSTATAQMQP